MIPYVYFKDEAEAEKWSWLFKPMGWQMCCSGGYYNAWAGPFYGR